MISKRSPHPRPESTIDVPDLIGRCAEADPEAWEDFVRRFHRRIVLYAIRARRATARAATADQCQDLVQDVYIRLVASDYRVLRMWRGYSEQSFLKYLTTIVHTVACDAVKRRSSRKRAASLVSLDWGQSEHGAPLHDVIPAPEDDSPEEILYARLLGDRFNAVLDVAERGPKGHRNRLIFTLYVVDGLTASEIAMLPDLRMSIANVESAIRRTRARLRSTLKDPRDLWATGDTNRSGTTAAQGSRRGSAQMRQLPILAHSE
jgi:RNA polymerase sigma-70 factor (ECF subfamily)